MFKVDLENQESRDILDRFTQEGAHYCEEWDGTLGARVLGLAKKQSQYLALRASLAGAIMRAMKLLALARTNEHTCGRIRLACAEILGGRELANEPAPWVD